MTRRTRTTTSPSFGMVLPPEKKSRPFETFAA